MKINYKDNKNKEIAEVGDLIQLEDGAIGLVLVDEEIALLKFSDGVDGFALAVGYKENFENGEYNIIAKVKDWEINIK